MRLVLDTNIYIAAFLNRAFLFKLLKTILDPKSGFTLYLSEEIYQELGNKLGLMKKKFLLDDENIADFLKTVRRRAVIASPREKLKVVKADPDDNKILECAVAAVANIIVTMDKDLLKIKQFRNIAIIHPKTLWFMFPADKKAS